MKQNYSHLYVFAAISFLLVVLIMVLSAKTPVQIDSRYLTAFAQPTPFIENYPSGILGTFLF